MICKSFLTYTHIENCPKTLNEMFDLININDFCKYLLILNVMQHYVSYKFGQMQQ